MDRLEVLGQRRARGRGAFDRGGAAAPLVGDVARLDEVAVQVRRERGGSLQRGGVLAQAAAGAEAHLHAALLAPALVGGGGDEIGQRGGEHGRLEGAQQRPHPVQEREALDELGEGRGLGEAELAAGPGRGAAQLREDLAAQLVHDLLGAGGLGVAADRRAVPGGLLGARAEHAHLGRLAQRLGIALALLAHHLRGDRGGQAHAGAGRGVQAGQGGERGDRVVGRGVPRLLEAVHRLDVADEDVAAGGELLGRAVLGAEPVGAGAAQAAQQRGGGVALQGRIRGEVEDELLEAAAARDLDELGEVAAALGDDEHAAAAGVELLGQVDDEVEAGGAGRGGHGEVPAGEDPLEHGAMAGVHGGDQLVLGHLGARGVACALHLRAGGLVAGERGDERGGGPVLARLGEILGDGAGGVHEVADHERVEDAEAGQGLAEGAEGVQDGVGVEAVGAVGRGQQRPRVDRDAGLAQGAQQDGVEVRGRVDLEVDVLAGVAAQAQGHGAHEHGGVDRLGAVLGVPDRLADAEMAGGQAHLLRMPLGGLADRAGVRAGVGERADLAHQRGQAGGAAPGEELGEPGGVGVGEVQHRAAGADLREEGGGGDAAGDLLGPAVQGVGDAVLAAEGAVFPADDGHAVLVLLGRDPGADLVVVGVEHDLVAARAGRCAALIAAVRCGLLLGGLLPRSALGGGLRPVGRLRGGPVPLAATLPGQGRQGVVT